MKCTQYFLFVKQRPDRAAIKEEWILETMGNPLRTEIQSDARIRKWGYIEEAEKYLRVYCWKMARRFIMLFSIELIRRD